MLEKNECMFMITNKYHLLFHKNLARISLNRYPENWPLEKINVKPFRTLVFDNVKAMCVLIL